MHRLSNENKKAKSGKPLFDQNHRIPNLDSPKTYNQVLQKMICRSL